MKSKRGYQKLPWRGPYRNLFCPHPDAAIHRIAPGNYEKPKDEEYGASSYLDQVLQPRGRLAVDRLTTGRGPDNTSASMSAQGRHAIEKASSPSRFLRPR